MFYFRFNLQSKKLIAAISVFIVNCTKAKI